MKKKILKESELKQILDTCEDNLLLVKYERRNNRKLSYSNRILEMMSLDTINTINQLIENKQFIEGE